MIQSIFILSPTGEVLIERHFRDVSTPRSVCDYFWERASISLNHHGGVSTTSSTLASDSSLFSLYDTVPPIMEITIDDHYNTNGSDNKNNNGNKTLYLFSILRDGLSYLAACPGEVSPLLVLECLHRVADVFVDYFGNPADESAIKENFSTVYQLLEEMLDYGWPLTTEPNALTAMIRPPSVMGKIQSVVTGGSNAIISDALPTGTISNMPWRTAGVQHHPNEIYIDIIEEIDAILDSIGNVISFDVAGSIQVQSHLSGVPDLLLTFKDPSVIDDCSFHPCVRYSRYEMDKVVSFVPPDGNFQLMRYRVKPSVTVQSHGFSPPISCTPQIFYGHGTKGKSSSSGGGGDGAEVTGRIIVDLSVRSISSLFYLSPKKGSVEMEDVAVTIPFHKCVKTANLSVNMGQVLYDEASKVAKWMIGNLDERKKPQLTGTMSLDTDGNNRHKRSDENPPLSVAWKIPLSSLSGLSVGGLTVTHETYKPYKGVRNIAKSGRFQVRCTSI